MTATKKRKFRSLSEPEKQKLLAEFLLSFAAEKSGFRYDEPGINDANPKKWQSGWGGVRISAPVRGFAHMFPDCPEGIIFASDPEEDVWRELFENHNSGSPVQDTEVDILLRTPEALVLRTLDGLEKSEPFQISARRTCRALNVIGRAGIISALQSRIADFLKTRGVDVGRVRDAPSSWFAALVEPDEISRRSVLKTLTMLNSGGHINRSNGAYIASKLEVNLTDIAFNSAYIYNGSELEFYSNVGHLEKSGPTYPRCRKVFKRLGSSGPTLEQVVRVLGSRCRVLTARSDIPPDGDLDRRDRDYAADEVKQAVEKGIRGSLKGEQLKSHLANVLDMLEKSNAFAWIWHDPAAEDGDPENDSLLFLFINQKGSGSLLLSVRSNDKSPGSVEWEESSP